ncbi:bile acid:sodium symporter family protein [Tepidicella xavieri]|jgi:BASS family bile acid:Na+ symporter|uniref:BASS family bile acid:Na+ symporter n=1 Tax=Tepidicella xavieri TaxID=360241 RepID=A0A4R6UJF8_9BURK|nr:bile acid:sodium symporter family protein [Tepidicella xavieri]TDQ45195.1 BASS family bile acid:Na+ symporter [Tepidicella xavieri]
MVTEFETKLLGIMMMVIMMGMGASLTWRDFLIAFRKPRGVLIGLLCQYGLMPFIGFSMAMLLGLNPAVAVGLLLIACMPGGTTSNIFTYFSKAVLALSIMMTSVSTLVALVMVPLLLEFYSQAAGITGEFKIPASNVAQVLLVLLVPTIIGMVLRKVNPNIGASIELLGGFLGIVVILFLIVTWVPRNHQLLAVTPLPVYAAAIGLGLVGMALGYGLARLMRQDPNRSRTIALETGIQNGPLAILIVTLSFTGPLQQEVLLIPVLYSLFIVLTSSAVTVFFRRLSEREALARDQAKAGSVLAAKP